MQFYFDGQDLTAGQRTLIDSLSRFTISLESLWHLLPLAERGFASGGDLSVPELRSSGRVFQDLLLKLDDEEYARTEASVLSHAEALQRLVDGAREAHATSSLFEWTTDLPDDPSVARAFQEFGVAYVREFRRPAALELVMRGILPVAVGSLEILAGSLIRTAYETWPGALGRQEKEFSLADLQRIGSVELAVAAAIEQRTGSVVRDGLTSWTTWFKQQPLKIDIEKFAKWDEILEIFQRRHVMAHNGGVASQSYLQRVDPALREGVQVGDPLPTDGDYMRKAINRLTAIGIVLWTHTATKVFDNDKVRPVQRHVFHECEELARDERWVCVKEVCAAVRGVKQFDAKHQLGFQFMQWLALKELHSTDVIRDDVNGHDTSVLNHYSRAVVAALIDDDELTLTHLQAALSGGELTLFDIRRSPFFRRLDPRLTTLRSGTAPDESAQAGDQDRRAEPN